MNQIVRLLGSRGLGKYIDTRRIYTNLCRYLLPNGISTVKFDGFTLDIERRAYPEMLIDRGIYLSYEVEVFKGLINPRMKILDLGAASGYFTLAAARLAGPDGQVVAFEPSPYSYKILRRNVDRSGYTNIKIVKKAVSDRSGVSKFYICKSNPLENSLVEEGRINTSEVVEVQTTTLDEYLEGYRTDLIKMNIEGAEPLVLRGMSQTIKDNPTLQMLVEFDPQALEGMGIHPEAYLDQLLKEFELQIVNIDHRKIEPYAGLEKIMSGLTRYNKVSYLICKRRKGWK